ncbi:MAG: hypothetical protein R3Y09_13355, partial [Clostridia bacterium]
VPEIPDVPDVPEIPDVPDVPDVPDEPEIPRTGTLYWIARPLIFLGITLFTIGILGTFIILKRGDHNEK